MDPLTHGLATLALQRGFFPRASARAVVAILAAGLIPDIDFLSAHSGPSAYLRWNRTATHSITFIFLLAIAAFLFCFLVRDKGRPAHRAANPETAKPSPPWAGFSWVPVFAVATVHVLLDMLQADSVAPLWPFSARRFSFDVSPAIDPWLLAVLAAAILFPELLRLVGDEIGSRSKRPRGRVGAIIGLSVALVYFGARALFHGNAVAYLEARTINGELPRRVAAFPDSVSPFLWHTVVESESSLHLANLRSMGGEVSYASGVTTLRKPEPSATLTVAQNSPAAIAFLSIARFPKATVEREATGYSVEITDLKNLATQSRRAIFADINVDSRAKLLSSELQWRADSKP